MTRREQCAALARACGWTSVEVAQGYRFVGLVHSAGGKAASGIVEPLRFWATRRGLDRAEKRLRSPLPGEHFRRAEYEKAAYVKVGGRFPTQRARQAALVKALGLWQAVSPRTACRISRLCVKRFGCQSARVVSHDGKRMLILVTWKTAVKSNNSGGAWWAYAPLWDTRIDSVEVRQAIVAEGCTVAGLIAAVKSSRYRA